MQKLEKTGKGSFQEKEEPGSVFCNSVTRKLNSGLSLSRMFSTGMTGR